MTLGQLTLPTSLNPDLSPRGNSIYLSRKSVLFRIEELIYHFIYLGVMILIVVYRDTKPPNLHTGLQ